MKSYEFAGEITADGQLKLPNSALSQLVGHPQTVRVIVFVEDSFEMQEEDAWKSLAAETFLAGYSPEDAIYDSL